MPQQVLYREALIWKRLAHPNIAPFKGATILSLRIAPEWMPGGDLTTYVNSNPPTNRVTLVSLPVHPPNIHISISHQLVDIASGLEYLHSLCVIHGDLKGVSTRDCTLGSPPYKCSVVKRPRGRFWPCAYHRFWPRSTHFRRSPQGRGSECTVDCTGGLSQKGNAKFGSGCFLFRDGHDRGALQSIHAPIQANHIPCFISEQGLYWQGSVQ